MAMSVDPKKEMDVIGHHYEFPASDTLTAFLCHVLYEMLVEKIVSQQRFAVKGAKGDDAKKNKRN